MYDKEIRFIRSLFPGNDNIPLHEPCFPGREKAYVMDAINSTFVSSVGAYVDKFEDMIIALTGAKSACATVNGTSALHAALLAIGVKNKDEVITQPLTFVGTSNAIRYCGAEPVFIDVDKDTLGLSPNALKSFFEKKTIRKNGKTVNKDTGRVISGCLPVHIFGHPCRIDEIVEVCSDYDVPVVEDCAESLGSRYKDRHTGRFGTLGVFSFNGNKIVTAGGGGVIISDDIALGKHLKHMTTTARVADGMEFYHDAIGFNYRMPNLNAALACAQLENLNYFIKNKRRLAMEYNRFFSNGCEDFFFLTEPADSFSIYWLNTVMAENQKIRNRFIQESHEAGITTRPAWRLMNRLKMFETCQTDALRNAFWLEKRIINLPSSVRI